MNQNPLKDNVYSWHFEKMNENDCIVDLRNIMEKALREEMLRVKNFSETL